MENKQKEAKELIAECLALALEGKNGKTKFSEQEGDDLALHVLTQLRAGRLPTSEDKHEFLKELQEGLYFTGWMREKIRLAVIVMLLPTFAFRKLLWFHNIDMISLPAFFRRITTKQVTALESAYEQLTQGVVPIECTQTLKERWLKFKGGMTAEKILNGDFDHLVQPKFLSKSAWSYSLFSLDFGFGKYVNGDENDAELSDARWTRFLSKKEHINDFVVNQEGGLYWFLYTFARSNPFWNTGKSVSLAAQVCPAFWATMLFNLLFWVISPLLFLTTTTGAIDGLHRIVSEPIALIGCFTPVLCLFGLLKYAKKTITKAGWFIQLKEFMFKTERSKRNWNRAFGVSFIVGAWGVFQALLYPALVYAGNHSGAIIFMIPLLIFICPFLKEILIEVVGAGKSLGSAVDAVIDHPDSHKIKSVIVSQGFLCAVILVTILGFFYPSIPAIISGLKSGIITAVAFVIFRLVPAVIAFVSQGMFFLVDIWAALLFVGAAGFLFWGLNKFINMKENPEKVIRFLESRFLIYFSGGAGLVMLVISLILAMYYSRGTWNELGATLFFIVAFAVVFTLTLLVVVHFASSTKEVIATDPLIAQKSYQLAVTYRNEWGWIVSYGELYWALVTNQWLRDNFEKYQEQLFQKMHQIIIEYSAHINGHNHGFNSLLLRGIDEPMFNDLVVMVIDNSNIRRFMLSMIELYNESPFRFKMFLRQWNKSGIKPELLLKEAINAYKTEQAETNRKNALRAAEAKLAEERLEKFFGPVNRFLGAIGDIIIWPFAKFAQGVKWVFNTVKDIGDLIKLFNERCPTVTKTEEL